MKYFLTHFILFLTLLFSLSSLQAHDLCYTGIEKQGFLFFSRTVIPIKNISGEILEDVHFYIDESGFAVSFANNCDTNPVTGACSQQNDIDLGPFGLLSNTTEYDLQNMANNTIVEARTKSLFDFDFFATMDLYVVYTKDSVIRKAQLNKCSDPTVTDPIIHPDPEYEQCGIFPSALNTWGIITTGNGDLVINADGTDGKKDVTCQLDGVTATCNVYEMPIDPPTLPTNIDSTLTNTINISGNLYESEYPGLNITGDTRFQATQSYSTTTSKYMTINAITGTSSGATLTFTEGDYYFGSWTNNADLIVRTEGKVRFFIDGDMILNNNYLDFNYNGEDGIPSDMYIFIGGNFNMTPSCAGSGYDMTAYVFAEGTFDAGTNTNNSSFRGAISAVGDITLNNNQTYTYDDDGLTEDGFGACGGGSSISYISGPFDAWDVSSTDTTLPPVIAGRQITTKIVNTPFTLSLASLNKDSDAYELKSGTGTISVSIYPKNSTTAISTSADIIFNASSSNHIEETSQIIVATANADAVVGFKLCATYQDESEDSAVKIYTLYDSGACSGALQDCNSTTSDTPIWHICHSSDNFAIRPYAFRVFGGDSYTRAGEDFNIDLKAVDQANYNKSSGASSTVIGTSNYNVSFSDLTLTSNFYDPTHTQLLTMYRNVMQDPSALAADDAMKARVATCSAAGVFTKINPAAVFTDGNLTASLKFSETGILTIDINETLGQEFSIVDEDDTSLVQRLILGSTIINSKSEIANSSLLLLNPYSIDAAAEYNTSTSNSWVYMNDISNAATTFTKPEMSAYLHYTVTAKNKGGAITKNFTSTCFPDVTETWPIPLVTDCPRVNGLKLNTTYDFKLAATINSTATVNLSIYNGDVDENALYIDLTDQDAALSVGDNSVRKATMYPKQFTNGVAESFVHFNIDRNITTVLNPVTIKVIDVNTWLSWSSSASPAASNGTTLNKSYNFIYGRTNAPRQRFTGDEGTALIYYEAYCSGVTCDKTLLPDGPGSTSINDPRWFSNSSHIVTSGNVGVVIQKRASSISSAAAIGIAIASTVLTYDDADTKGYPYKATMENNASLWLIYNQYKPGVTTNEFEVEFTNTDAKWAGVRETNTTTNINSSSKTNRRTMW